MGRVCSAHGEMRNMYRFLLESLKARDQSEDYSLTCEYKFVLNGS
jgi:hypothetical protein